MTHSSHLIWISLCLEGTTSLVLVAVFWPLLIINIVHIPERFLNIENMFFVQPLNSASLFVTALQDWMFLFLYLRSLCECIEVLSDVDASIILYGSFNFPTIEWDSDNFSVNYSKILNASSNCATEFGDFIVGNSFFWIAVICVQQMSAHYPVPHQNNVP